MEKKHQQASHMKQDCPICEQCQAASIKVGLTEATCATAAATTVQREKRSRFHGGDGKDGVTFW